jgi:alpha-glucosidase
MRALYPNLLTREGLIGMEYDKWSDKASPVHDLMIPFLRMWVGPMDYTPGAMLNSQPRTFFCKST